MVRVVAGKYRRLNLEGPKNDDIRPTMDRAKEGLFNVINMGINQSSFLDLFSGTGAMAIEAISRDCDAKNTTLVDGSTEAIKLIKTNVAKIEEQPTIVRADVFTYLERETKQYDYIFMDPPYNMKLADIQRIMDLIVKNHLLTADGQIIFEFETKKGIEFENVNLVKFKNYGISGFSFYEI